ncbi:unnamed protein product [Rotaria sordida]|uniref:Potassium channel n=1 Tax=Rotaria sordida TaxID=392033 RepID=A0A813XP76_9BILA|nr:unnamed protein product [Rotaria sordida]CAF4108142.1 unnamed protein product [Rotaria sordida]
MNGWAKDALDCLLSMTTFFESEDDRLTINISGTHYEINVSDIINFPDTVLGDPLKRARYLVPGTSHYFFPHHPSSFESILYYYINDGVLIKAETIPAIIFYEEIRFFQLNEKLIQTFYNDYLSINEDNHIEPNSYLKKTLYQTFYHPPINYLNSLFNILSAVFNALAIYSLCLETMSIYRNFHNTMWMITHPSKPFNRTEGFKCSDISLRPYQFIPYFNSENTTLEILCVTWFYFELFIRTLSVPSFTHLINDPNFALDILSILPTILSQIFYRFYIFENQEENLLTLKETQLFDYLTCLKLFRLFRLTRHAKCLEVFIKVLYINLKDILMLTILIIFGIFYFGLTQFVLEQLHQDNEIKNIGEALWHGFTVITTVGYSDIAEHQFLSYIFAIVGVWYGSISMAIILPSLIQSFNIFHNFKYRRYIFKYKTD